MSFPMEKLVRVQADRRFDAILSADPVLNALDGERYGRADEFAALAAVLGGRFSVSSSPVEFPALTPAVWAVLWMLESPFTRQKGASATEADADLFLFLLRCGVDKMPNLERLPDEADGFVYRAGINPEDAILSIRQMVHTAFRPLEMLPRRPGMSEPPSYDADWLTWIASTVCRETNFDADRVIFRLPLASCYYYVIQAARRNDAKNSIRRRSSGEVCEAIYRRTVELAEAFYNEVISHADDCKTRN